MTLGPRDRGSVDLLLAAVRSPRRMAAMGPLDWGALIPAAEEARLLPRLAADAERLGLTSGLPGWTRDRLTSALVRGHEFERAVKWEIDRVHRALLPIGLRPVFLKGAAYIAAALPCGVGRVVADVDILVPETELSRAQLALQDHGWEFEPLDPYDERYYRDWMHELPPMRNRHRGTLLDVHHRILPRTGRIHPPTQRLLEQARDAGGTAVLSPEHMVLHAAAHLFQDGEVAGALRDVVDLRDLLEQFGGDSGFEGRLIGEARALGLGRPLFYAIRYARLAGCTIDFVGVRSWQPSAPLLAAMDRLVERTLTRPDTTSGSLGAFALYTRSHWLKMPVGLLLRHLARKVTKNFSS